MLAKISNLVRILGTWGAVVYIFQKLCQRVLKTGHPYILISKHARYPLLCRPDTSDMDVFYQIFFDREYRCVDDVMDVGLMIDCGANVGYSSAYLLSRFPRSHIIAIEPDGGNFSMLTKNLKPYNERVKLLHSAVWSQCASLKMSELKYLDGKEWTRQVRECKKGETADFTGVDIATVLKDSGYERISVLKIDIEGAEGVIFSSPTYKMWIDKVDVMIIELHDDSIFGNCSKIFYSAMENQNFEISRCEELTVCKRRQIKVP